ncbi:MAG: serine hydrolase domain-containing protein [Ilumatobacteraceae bacterium]
MSASIDQVLQDAVANGAVPNVVAMAADRDGIVYEGAAGPRVGGEDEPVAPDTHFRIMSMTKMVATVAALQQMEQGRLELDAPIDTYCPQFADLQVLDGFDGDEPRLRAPASRATIKQLITHTTGLGYWFWNAGLVRWESATGTPNVLSGSNVIFTAPLLADPGTTYEYGINTDWLGKVVEAVSGVALDVAIKEGITGPLGMDETTFIMSPEQRATSTPIHLQSEDGAWAASGVDLNQGPE